MTEYSPIIKSRGFCPNPVALYGIPEFADSIENPRCVGTIAHEDWWNEQIHYCINGYDTGGLHITGRHYYFLNFSQLLSVDRDYNHVPDFVDSDYAFYTAIDECRKNHKGIIVPKKRRYGVSHIIASIFSHGARFRPSGYNAGIVSGLDEYSKDFFEKFKDDNLRKPPEFALNHLYDNKGEWQAGYTLFESKKKDGSFNNIFALTANANENVFKGKILNDCVFEEGGEFKNIVATYGATKGCFMKGMRMIGMPFLFGTGGRMKNSEGFKQMVENPDDYGLVVYDIYGPRKYPPCYIGGWFLDDDGNKQEAECPNLKERFEHLAPEQIIGCEDVIEATRQILETTDKLKVGKNKQPYYDHLQTFPLNRREMFLNFSGNPFDPDMLSHQAQEIAILPQNKYQRYLLSWEVDAKGVMVQPRRVKRTIAPHHLRDDECILMSEDAVPGMKNLDVMGIDSYDQNTSSTSKSLGGAAVLRRRDLKTNKECRKPICIIRMRPMRKEIFYEACLMVACYYNLKKNVLIDVEKPLIIEYFVANDGQKYLAERPKSFEGPKSEQNHKWGIKFTTFSKPRVIGVTESWVLDDIQDCWFIAIIKELSDYNVGVTGDESDWDLADALMIALARIADMGHRRPPQASDEVGRNDADLPEWKDGKRVNAKGEAENAGWANAGVDREVDKGTGFSLVEFK